ncbi:MAG: DUF362 domain-containing protein [Deltaproteobacteria bacterium]|nr:DUF362 domain-containing protein [Deltaproteobacteria bacterium]
MKKTEDKQRLSRRDFLAGAAGAAIVSAIGTGCEGGCSAQAKPPQAPEPAKTATESKPTGSGRRSKVVLVRDQRVLGAGRQVDGTVLARMFDDAVTELLDEPDPAAAWSRLVQADDTVGIKSNVWRYLRTPEELEQTIIERVSAQGVDPNRIGVDDRGVLRNPLFSKTSALINVRPMRTHHWSGVGSCIKNYIMFSPEPSSWHDDSCAGLAGVWDLPVVKGKTRLNVLVMLTPLFHGKGPHHYNSSYTWEYGGLIVGRDPVAVDAVGVRILNAKRAEHFGNDQPFVVPPKHITVAEQKFGLGVADPDRIDLVRLGWESGALI